VSTSPDSLSPQEHSGKNSQEQEEISAAPVSDQASTAAGMPKQAQTPSPEPRASLPPEAQGEANGGPLGCCLGMVVGLLATLVLTTALPLLIVNQSTIGLTALPIALIFALAGGYFGWKIGKKVYKEYPPPVVKDRRDQTQPKRKKNGLHERLPEHLKP
jgi:hypothetical protein